MSPEVTRRTLVYLTQYLKDLQRYHNVSDEEYAQHHYEIERLLQLIIEVACDINAHLISQAGNKPPIDYYQSSIELGTIGILIPELAHQLAPFAGLRNALVHAYENINEEKVKRSI